MKGQHLCSLQVSHRDSWSVLCKYLYSPEETKNSQEVTKKWHVYFYLPCDLLFYYFTLEYEVVLKHRYHPSSHHYCRSMPIRHAYAKWVHFLLFRHFEPHIPSQSFFCSFPHEEPRYPYVKYVESSPISDVICRLYLVAYTFLIIISAHLMVFRVSYIFIFCSFVRAQSHICWTINIDNMQSFETYPSISVIDIHAPGYQHPIIGIHPPGYQHSIIGKHLPTYQHSLIAVAAIKNRFLYDSFESFAAWMPIPCSIHGLYIARSCVGNTISPNRWDRRGQTLRLNGQSLCTWLTENRVNQFFRVDEKVCGRLVDGFWLGGYPIIKLAVFQIMLDGIWVVFKYFYVTY